MIPRTIHNVVLVATCAILVSTVNYLLQMSVRKANFTPYAINFFYDLVATGFSGLSLFLEQGCLGLESWKLLLANALFFWMYQWSSLHALELLPLGVVAGLVQSFNPIFAAAFSAAILLERPTCWFGGVFCRNIAVIWLMLTPLIRKQEGGHYELDALHGALWTLPVAFSTTSTLVVQRLLKGVSPYTITFWGFAVNTILWMPPGVSPEVRVPFLWPPTANDDKTAKGSAWVWIVAAGAIAAVASVMIAKSLAVIPVPTFIVIFAPVLIGMNCIYDFLGGTTIQVLTFAGLLVVMFGLILDIYLDKKMTTSSEQKDETPAEATPLLAGDSEGHSTDTKRDSV